MRTALASDDAEIAEVAEVAAELPKNAYIADLRDAEYPPEGAFARHMQTAAYTRFRQERFLAATSIPFG